jgi:hypothetical protein
MLSLRKRPNFSAVALEGNVTNQSRMPLAEQARAATAVEAPAKAKRLRGRAEECRVLAQMMRAPANAAYYLGLAETYDGLAEQQERLARDIVKFDIKTSTTGP